MKVGWHLGHQRIPSSDRPPLAAWQEANPKEIERALERALAKPTGGWHVLDASRRIGRRPRAFVVDGLRLVAWRRADGGLLAGPEACPHMGASLAGARVCGDAVVCPWHGLELGPGGHGRWRPLPTHDDGTLAWVRIGAAEVEAEPTTPVLPERPVRTIASVVRLEARCEPRDVLANRLDPWHGPHFHPYSFGQLRVIDRDDEAITVRVSKRILGPLRVTVDARFDCPDARSIVMTIVAGEGRGSVVETHATPIGPGRTAIVEASFATSPRFGFRLVRHLAPLIRPFVEAASRRLWVDDAAYAERLHELREAGR